MNTDSDKYAALKHRRVVVKNLRPSRPKPVIGSKSKTAPQFSLSTAIHSSERVFHEGNPTHTFEVKTRGTMPIFTDDLSQTTLEPPSHSPEKYALFEKYQLDIHHDDKSTMGGFKSFLVSSPFKVRTFNDCPPFSFIHF